MGVSSKIKFNNQDFTVYFMTQINWDSGEHLSYIIIHLSYTFEEDLFPQEPCFLPTPGGTEEDDGVLLIGGFDAKKERGMHVVYDILDTAYKLC
jgi:carotenoid cleavage dioxygenase-like enzyme